MSSDVAIDVRDLGKVYRIFRTPPDRLKQVLWRGRRKFYEEFWALHPLSFQVRKGECIGFVGKNGSGKSTLLQMIAGTLDPSHGSFNVSGRLSALLELGAGFNPEFTGRENVMLTGALLGVSAAEMKDRMPAILEFSELGDFIDKPVKTYSSGMFVRLAFSAAIHVEPEILLVDEALSVGDAAFQYKCLRKIEDLRANGMSILFVTHDTAAVKKICDRAGWIHGGKLVCLGDTSRVVDDYDSFMREKASAHDASRPAHPSSVAPREHDGAVPSPGERSEENVSHAARICSVKLFDGSDGLTSSFLHGESMKVEIEYEVMERTSGIVVGAAMFRNDELYISGLNTGLDQVTLPTEPGRYVANLFLPRIALLGGEYFFKVGVFDRHGMVRWDFIEDAARFKVSGGYVAEGLMVPDHSWSWEPATSNVRDCGNIS